MKGGNIIVTFYLKDAISNEKQPREFSWRKTNKKNTSTNTQRHKIKFYQKKMEYLFVPLIFLISQQGFYALLHPKDAKEK